jgi:putative transcriptional regulator
MPDAQPQVRNHIRRLRFERGEWTQDQLAQMTGVTRHTIMALEAGKYFPSLLLAFRIARAFGVGVEQVFEYAEVERAEPSGVENAKRILKLAGRGNAPVQGDEKE